ncbi:hypothetical protein niasHS_005079 [Heterodera schachtii]|uniref:Hexosyltransferase n=1 Tax=Heterodera schachtii TaxID=97005 RepID=A0ABD2JLZ8_HETSC
MGSSHSSVANLLATDQQPLVPINPWPTLFPRPLIEPNCRHNILSRHNSVLIIVKSAPDRRKHRDAVRSTYGAMKRYPPASEVPPAVPAPAVGTGGDTFFRLRTIFVLGRPAADDAAQMNALEREAATHGDLLVGDFMDTYFNNTLKFVHSVRFARHYCALPNSVPFVLLLDDDFLLFPWNLITELQKCHKNK